MTSEEHPLGKIVDVVSKINTGAKYDSKAFQKSVGLNGVGTKAVNALSDDFEVTAYREGKQKSASFKRGQLIQETKESKPPSQMVHWWYLHQMQQSSRTTILSTSILKVNYGIIVI